MGTSDYFFGGQRVAMRDSGGVSYIHGDHLTSATNTTGAETSGAQYYYPYGAQRSGDTLGTPYRYTGQREETDLGFYDYKARWYDPELGRFLQADTVVPEAGNPQSYNRYAYVYTDPTHCCDRVLHRLNSVLIYIDKRCGQRR